MEVVFKRLLEAHSTVKPSKCKFLQDHVRFLGHEVRSGKRSPSDVNIQTIKDFPTITTKTQLRSYLGTVGYYSKCIKNYTVIVVPFTDALKM